MEKFQNYHVTHPHQLAIGYSVLSTFIYACITVLVKLIPTVPTFQLIQSYNILLFFMLYPISKKVKFPTYKDPNALTALLIFRCLVSFSATMCWFMGALYVSAAETEIIFNLGVFWTTIYAVFIKRSRSLSKLICAIFVLLLSGLICIATAKTGNASNLDFSNRMFGIGLLSLGSFFNSLIEICQNKLSADYNVQVNNVMMSIYVVSVICTGIIQISAPEGSVHMLTLYQYMIIFLISLLSMIGLYSFNLAFKLGEISTVSILQLLTLIYGFLFDIFVFHLQVKLLTLLGAILISSGIMLNLLQKE